MNEKFLGKLFEHNNWANLQIIQACSALGNDQLDAEPQSATKGSIRSTLLHLVSSQHSYLRTLTLPLEARLDAPTVAFAERKQPLAGGFLDPADIAAAAAWLCSDDSRQVTGQVIAVDGGWTVSDGR